MAAIILNKNTSKLKNTAIKIDLILVSVTIVIPIILLRLNIKLDIFIVPLFVIFYALFSFLNNNAHKVYLDNKNIEEKKENLMVNKKRTLLYILILIITGVLLYIVGNLLGDTLEELCRSFNVPEFVIGVFLGFITSIPELITFFESQSYNKKTTDEMIGVIEATNNLFMSNVMNLFIIQTIGVLLLQFT